MTDEVRQEDREAAGDFMASLRGYKQGLDELSIKEGLNDLHPLVQAFARHASPLRTRIAELEGALAKMQPLADTLYQATAANEGWGRVVVGQVEAARELHAIMAATLNGEKKHG